MASPEPSGPQWFIYRDDEGDRGWRTNLYRSLSSYKVANIVWSIPVDTCPNNNNLSMCSVHSKLSLRDLSRDFTQAVGS